MMFFEFHMPRTRLTVSGRLKVHFSSERAIFCSKGPGRLCSRDRGGLPDWRVISRADGDVTRSLLNRSDGQL